jgi:hypothetical protein
LTYFTTELMINPRLQHLWSAAGGNLREYIKDEARDRYDARLPDPRWPADPIGPYRARKSWFMHLN